MTTEFLLLCGLGVVCASVVLSWGLCSAASRGEWVMHQVFGRWRAGRTIRRVAPTEIPQCVCRSCDELVDETDARMLCPRCARALDLVRL